MMLLLCAQESPEALAEALSTTDVEARVRSIDAIVARGPRALPLLRAVENGAFNADAKAGAKAAIKRVLRRARVEACAPPAVKVSVPAGKYAFEDAADRALKPFGVAWSADPTIAGKTFRFELETSNAWTAAHAISRQGGVAWTTKRDDKGSRMVFHEPPPDWDRKLFALVGPYCVGGRIEKDWADAPLVLYLSAPPGMTVSRAAVSKIKLKDAAGTPVVVDKVDLDSEGGGRTLGVFGYVMLAVVHGTPEALARVHSVEGELRVGLPDDLREDEFDLAAAPKETKLPLSVENGDVELLPPQEEGGLNLYFHFNGTGKRFLAWLENDANQVLMDVVAWNSGVSGNVNMSDYKGGPRWLVVARIEKESETVYPFEARRQKP